MANKNSQLTAKVADYYSTKIREFGSTPAGVDWNGDESQLLRFAQLGKVISQSKSDSFSVADLGCGYGALYDFLSIHYEKMQYRGFDLSSEMCDAAKQHLDGNDNASIAHLGELNAPIDYAIASGIFNVRLSTPPQEWYEYINQTLDNLNQFSTRGFSFNCLTSFSDEEKMRDYLYYANPGELFDLCKSKYSKNVALLHDYGLYEFTILVRK